MPEAVALAISLGAVLAETVRRPIKSSSAPYSGISTVSMTWITPLDCLTSAMVTVAVPPFRPAA